MTKIESSLKSKFPEWPTYSRREIDAVSEVLKTGSVNYLTGTRGREFELAFGQFVGCDAVVLSNGTVALESCLIALGIGCGDEVIVPAMSFVATASAVVRTGATPVFADIERYSRCIDAASIEQRISSKTKAIIVVHLGGHPADLSPIWSLAGHHSLAVIEDCAQAHGAKYDGLSVGNMSSVGSWSFCTDKIISCGGEGGAVTSRNKTLLDRIWSLKDHGKARKRRYPGPNFKYVHENIGTNFRMTEMQSAIGLVQLENLSDMGSMRRANLSFVLRSVENEAAIEPETLVDDHRTHGAYRGYLQINNSCLKSAWSRDRIIGELFSLGIPVSQGSCPEIYREKAFNWLRLPAGFCSTSASLGETAISFPVHHLLDQNHLGYLVDKLLETLKLAKR